MTENIRKYTSVITVWTVVAMSLLFSIQATAQCVNCQESDRIPGVMVCKSSRRGAQECQAVGDTCQLAGVCGGRIPPIGDTAPSFADEGKKLEIEANLIRQIAEVHPRFAYALATIAKNGLLSDEVKIYILPKQITIEDVEKRLTSAQLTISPIETPSAPSLSKGKVDKQEKFSPVIYEVSLQGVSKLTMKVIQGSSLDPAFTKLEINLVEINGINNGAKKIKATDWRIE